MLKEIDDFILYCKCEKALEKSTIVIYYNELIKLYGFFLNVSSDSNSKHVLSFDVHDGDIDITAIQRKDLIEYIEFNNKKKLKTLSILNMIKIIKMFFNYSYKKGVITKNPSRTFETKRKEHHLPTVLYYDEIETLTSFKIKTYEDYKDLAIILTLYSTGCRVGELTSALLVDLNLKEGTLKILGKGRKERYVYISELAKRAIVKYLEERKRKFIKCSEYLFVTCKNNPMYYELVNRIFKIRRKQTGVLKKVTPHVLRHSFATEMLNNGVDIIHIAEFLGHKSLKSTQVYTHVAKDRLKDAYNKYHPYSSRNIHKCKKKKTHFHIKK